MPATPEMLALDDSCCGPLHPRRPPTTPDSRRRTVADPQGGMRGLGPGESASPKIRAKLRGRSLLSHKGLGSACRPTSTFVPRRSAVNCCAAPPRCKPLWLSLRQCSLRATEECVPLQERWPANMGGCEPATADALPSPRLPRVISTASCSHGREGTAIPPDILLAFLAHAKPVSPRHAGAFVARLCGPPCVCVCFFG